MKLWLSLLIILIEAHALAGPKIQKDAQYFANFQEDLAWFETAEAAMPANDTRGLFLKVYHSVTKEMPAMFEEKQFENPEWVNQLMLKYVSLYRNALDCSLNKNCEISPAWRVAFKENARNVKPASIQLILSISAHVNRDLPIALAEIDTNFQNESMHRDFQKISLIFQRRMPELIALVQEYQKCSLGTSDRKLINQIIQWAMNRTREEAWTYATQLAKVKTDTEESTLVKQIEKHALQEDTSIKIAAPTPELLMCL